jgi:hypothetical protein
MMKWLTVVAAAGFVAVGVVLVAPAGGGAGQQVREVEVPPGYAFYFTRARYSDGRSQYGARRGGWRGGRGSWATDYPKADIQFLIGLKRLTVVDAYDFENAVPLDDPALRRYPLVYAVEVGRMALTPSEVEGLRSYLLAGGMLIVDDFWGTWEWANFEQNIRQVLPEYPIVDLPMDHPVLSTLYQIDQIVQVPNVWNGRSGGPTWERDGYYPALRGMFDDKGRLLVLISWNSDLGDAWEWAEDPFYPIRFSNFAYQLGVNMVIYGMTR